MSITSRIYQYFAKQIQPFIRSEVYSPSQLITGFSQVGSDADVWADYTHQAFEQLGITSPLVKPNIDMISKSITRSTLEVFEGDDEEPIKKHPLDYITNTRPMPGMGATFAWWYNTTWLTLHGEAYWMIVPNGFNELAWLVPIPANQIKPIPWKASHGGEPRLISYFSYTPYDPYYPERLEVNQVLFHKLPNPFNPIRGLSPLSVYLMMLKTVTEADKFDLDDYIHGLTLSKIISLRTDIANRDFLQALADWKQAAAEGARFRIFRGGDVDVKDLSTRRGEDGQNVHERARYYADRVWGIPEGLRDKNATEASAKVADLVYQRETIKPILDLLAEDINTQVVEQFYGQDIHCAFASTIPVDITNELKQKEDDRKTMTYNEARQAEGRTPHPDKRIGDAPFFAVTEAIKIIYQSEYAKVVDVEKTEELDIKKDENINEPVKEEDITPEAKAVLKPKGKPLSQLSEEEIAELAQKEIEDYLEEFNNRNPELTGILDASVNGNGKGE